MEVPILTRDKAAVQREAAGSKAEFIAIALLLLICSIGYSAYYMTAFNPPIPFFQVFVSIPVFIAMLSASLGLASESVVEFWKQKTAKKPETIWLYPVVLWGGVALYSLASGEFNPASMAKLALFLAVPVLLGRVNRLWADWLIGLAVWLPIQYRLLQLPRMPVGGATGMQLELFCAVGIAFWTLLVVRQLEGFQFRLAIPKEDILFGLKLFGIYALAFGTIGILIGFLQWRPFTLHQQYQIPDIYAPLAYLIVPIGMYFGVALVEETLFRGIVQNLLAKTIRSALIALLLTSVLFGIVHVKGEDTTRAYQWIYGLFATAAGIFYGYAYLKTGRITAGAVCHALVNSIWLILFNPRHL